MRVPMLALGAVCVAIGLAPVLFWPAIATRGGGLAAGAGRTPRRPRRWSRSARFIWRWPRWRFWRRYCLWRRVQHNGVSRAGTWDCGYAAPTPRMQYTAGSFAGIITGWFDWILRPERHAHLPRGNFSRARRFRWNTRRKPCWNTSSNPPARLVMRISTAVRRLQHGRVQFYILYLLVGLAALAILVVMGGAK